MDMEKKHKRPKGLKPCPFCRSKDLILKKIFEWYVSNNFVCCQNCFCWGPQCNTEEEAVEKWNER